MGLKMELQDKQDVEKSTPPDQNKMSKSGIIGVPKREELPKLVLECIAEAFGTFIIVFFGCGSALRPSKSHQEFDVVQVSLAFGLAVFVGAQVCGPISGGYMNPAVVIGGLVARRLSAIRSILFVAFQIIGAIVGAGVLQAFTPHTLPAHELGMNSLQVSKLYKKRGSQNCDDIGSSYLEQELSITECKAVFTVSAYQGFFMELIVTMVFVLLILNVTEERNGPQWSPPMMIGLTVTLAHVLLIPYTGCSINPARSLGPAVVLGKMKDQWIFWAGPLGGGLLAGLFHTIGEKILN